MMTDKPVIPLFAPEKKWYTCPACGQRLLIYADGAKCSGVYIRCKGCKREVEVRI